MLLNKGKAVSVVIQSESLKTGMAAFIEMKEWSRFKRFETTRSFRDVDDRFQCSKSLHFVSQKYHRKSTVVTSETDCCVVQIAERDQGLPTGG